MPADPRISPTTALLIAVFDVWVCPARLDNPRLFPASELAYHGLDYSESVRFSTDSLSDLGFPTHANRREVDMKSRAFLILLSPALYVLFASAQQAASNAPPQAPLQNIGTTCKEPLTPPPSTDFWDGDQPNVFNLVGHAFNRKRDVQKQVKPIQNCLNDLDEAAASHTRMIKDVDSHSQQGLQLASSKTVEAD